MRSAILALGMGSVLTITGLIQLFSTNVIAGMVAMAVTMLVVAAMVMVARRYGPVHREKLSIRIRPTWEDVSTIEPLDLVVARQSVIREREIALATAHALLARQGEDVILEARIVADALLMSAAADHALAAMDQMRRIQLDPQQLRRMLVARAN